MAYDEDDDDDYVDESEEALGNVARWVPLTVVSVAITGFVLLGWYAYQAGTQSVNEEDLLVVEADDTPVKQKPEDPGGMQFPNQDKMIFETFSDQKKEPPKVERLMPEPEEPVVVSKADQETTTWVNEKLQDKQPAVVDTPSEEEKENFIQEAAVDKAPTKVETAAVDSFRKEETQARPEAQPVKTLEKNMAKGNAQLQLGAYRSEKEAKAGWSKISSKHGSLLGGYNHTVIRADLGAKGIYYRLRVTGLSNVDAARDLCKKLTAQGQACMPIAG